MTDNYTFYANESSTDKENRVDGYGLEKLNYNLQQSNKNQKDASSRSIKRQATSQTQNGSENDDSVLYIDEEQTNPFTVVNKKQSNQKRKIQRGNQYDYNYNRYDEAYKMDNQVRTRNHQNNSRKTKINENTVDTVNDNNNDLGTKLTDNNTRKNTNSYPVNNQALSYATDMHLTPLRIKCNPILTDKNSTVKFVKEIFKKMEHGFRLTYTEHKKVIGFDYWWIDKEGDLIGITNDLSLYVYLCDVRHYPQEIGETRITPILPVHLPPQHAIVIKFVPNDYSYLDIEEDLKVQYPSIYHIEEMNGTKRLNNRHIRMDIYDKMEYNNILNGGVITLGGLLCEVDEYLPAPKVLICNKCICPGHTRKTCRLDYERCRRCGNDRNQGDHKQCGIICYHCGGNHQANDYKCPTIFQFRQDIIQKLREDPNRLPPHIQMFVPHDCRLQRSERIINNRNSNDLKKSQQNYSNLNSTSEWPLLRNTSNTNNCSTHIKEFQAELDSLKIKYQFELEKINNKYQQLSTNLQKTCLMMQTQINTQKEMIDSNAAVIKDLTFNMNTNVVNILNNFIQLLSEITPNDKSKQKFNMWQDHLKVQHQLICDKQTSFNNHIDNLSKLWLKQSNSVMEIIDLYLPANNNEQ